MKRNLLQLVLLVVLVPAWTSMPAGMEVARVTLPVEPEASSQPTAHVPPEDEVEAPASTLAEALPHILRERQAHAGSNANLFLTKSWYVPPPPPPPAKPAPPPPPTPPPLPFNFLGSYQEPDGRLVIFLTRGERLYSVSPGDVIDGTYRVGTISKGQLGLTYLPLKIRQSMNIGESS